MENNRLTFFDPTNFNVPISIFRTLVDDAFRFRFIKNGAANLSGLLNHLIPTLAQYREDLHLDFLKQNDGDEALTKKVEECIYKRYFRQFDFCDDGNTTIPFRVNQAHQKDFLKIHDILLPKYNMDFSTFVRSLLLEYATRRSLQREYFFQYNLMSALKKAIQNECLCHFYCVDNRHSCVPISLEVSDDQERNIIIGVNKTKDEFYSIPLASVLEINVDEKTKIHIEDELYPFILDSFASQMENNEQYKNKETT